MKKHKHIDANFKGSRGIRVYDNEVSTLCSNHKHESKLIMEYEENNGGGVIQ